MFSVSEIARATGGKLVQGDKDIRVGAVSTDTRTVSKGELFVAIKGEKFDAHDFLRKAQEKGAAALMVHDKKAVWDIKKDTAVILVKDTTKAYGELASYHRRKFKVPVIAITGSNGKTTTKEMVWSILSKKFKTLKNEGTHNNHIGVPATILKMDKSHRAVVLELGTNHPGEIRYLAKIACPTIGVITNVGPSHIEHFKNLNNVLKEKSGIFQGPARGTIAVLNGDDKLLRKLKVRAKKFYYGKDKTLDFYAAQVRHENGMISYLLNGRDKIVLKMPGAHNVSNSLAAAACARLAGIPTRDIQGGLSGFKAPKMRMEARLFNEVLLINDAYNSNPQSMRSGIQTLRDWQASGRKILVCADMLELGERSAEYHYQAGEFAGQSKLDYILAVGKLSRHICKGAKAKNRNGSKVMWFKTPGEAASCLLKIVRPFDVILVKGSRGMKMEEVAQCFTTCCTR